MDPVTGAAIIGAGANLYGGSQSAKAQQKANQKNLEWQKYQFHFNDKRQGQQYQRAMADMRKAGLNPMLAYMQGGTAQGQAISAAGQQAEDPNIGESVGAAVSGITSALANKRLKKEISAIEAGIEKTKAETTNIKGDNPANEIKKHAMEQAQDAILGFSAKKKQKRAEEKAKKNYHKSQASRDKLKWLDRQYKKGKIK